MGAAIFIFAAILALLSPRIWPHGFLAILALATLLTLLSLGLNADRVGNVSASNWATMIGTNFAMKLLIVAIPFFLARGVRWLILRYKSKPIVP